MAQVATNCDGMASDERWGPKPSCEAFQGSGEDNGVVCRIEDQVQPATSHLSPV